MQLNTNEIYAWVAFKEAQARRVGDEASAAHHRDHFRRMLALESTEAQVKIEALYRQTYRDTWDLNNQ